MSDYTDSLAFPDLKGDAVKRQKFFVARILLTAYLGVWVLLAAKPCRKALKLAAQSCAADSSEAVFLGYIM